MDQPYIEQKQKKEATSKVNQLILTVRSIRSPVAEKFTICNGFVFPFLHKCE